MQDGAEIGEESLVESFYAPFSLFSKNGLDSVIMSLLKIPALDNNQHVNSIFTDHMFEQPNEGNTQALIYYLVLGIVSAN